MTFTDAEQEARARARLGSVVRGKYTLVRVLGMGGMGVVYEALHRNRARFALKLLHPELSLGEAAHARFHREAYAANVIQDEGVVRVVDDDLTDDGAAFLVMDMLAGASVEDVALREGAGGVLPMSVALAIMSSTLRTLEAAHTQRLVHRDIKPGNLFLTNDGKVKVLDFGIARALDGDGEDRSRVTASGVPLGTPAFMAPEQVGAADETDARTDVWAAGATLFVLLSGRPVHSAQSVGMALVLAATEHAPALQSVAPDVPRAIGTVIDRALAFRREDRWPSAEAMRDALGVAAGEAGIPLMGAADLGKLAARVAAAQDVAVALSDASELAVTDVAARPIDALAPTQADASLRALPPVHTTTNPASRVPSRPLIESQPRPAPPTAKRRRPWPVLFGLPVLAATLGGLLVRQSAPSVTAVPAPSTAAALAAPAASLSKARDVALLLSFEVRAVEPLLEGVASDVFESAMNGSTSMDTYGGHDLLNLTFALAPDLDQLPAALRARGHGRVILVHGVAQPEGPGFRFSAEATDPTTHAIVGHASTSTSSLASSVTALTTLARDLRRALGDSSLDPSLGDSSGLSDLLEADREWLTGTDLIAPGQAQAAIAHLERAIQLDGSFHRAHADLATAYYNAGRFADSTRELTIAAGPGPMVRRVRMRTEADRDAMVGKPVDAIRVYEELESAWPEDSGVGVALAETWILMRQPRRALALAVALVDAYPALAAMRTNLPAYYLLSGDLASAEVQANLAFEKTAHFFDSVPVCLGVARALGGRIDEARASYAQVQAPMRAAYALIDLDLFAGDIDAAAAEGRRLARQPGVETDAHSEALLAELELRRGHAAEARTFADRAAHSAEPWARYVAARVYAELGDTAKLDNLPALEGVGGPDAVHVTQIVRGIGLRKRKSLGAALDAFKEALAITDSWPVHLELAETYLARGETAAARTELEICKARRGEGALLTLLYDVPTLRYVRRVDELLGATSPGHR